MKLSITIATYNVQNFIRESIESILNQSFQDFELICIDDGSKDDTPAILRAYAAGNNRIQVIEKEVNEGLSAARNLSLQIARGEYITFLDGDDFYHPTLFEKAISLADKEQSDMVLWDYVPFYQNGDIEKSKDTPSDLLEIDPRDKRALLQRPSFTWVKLLRTEKARELGIHFPVGMTRQDIPAHWHLITKVEKVSILAERLAYYRQQGDATTAKKDKRLFDLIFVMDLVEKYLKDQHLFEIYEDLFYKQQLNFFFGMYDTIQQPYKEEALDLIKQRFTGRHESFLKQSNLVRPQAKQFLLALSGDRSAFLKLKFWKFARAVYRIIKNGNERVFS